MNYSFILDYKRVVDLLIKSGANVNHQDNEGKSVLHWAAAKGYPHISIWNALIIRTEILFYLASDAVAELLINGGATKVSVLDNIGKTPLFYATLAGKLIDTWIYRTWYYAYQNAYLLLGNTAFVDVLTNFLSSGCELSSYGSIGLLLLITFSLVI